MELDITDVAAEEFNKSVEGIEPKPYLRIGAKPGGCSGWIFVLETDEGADITDSVFTKDQYDKENVILNLIIQK